MGIVNGIKGLLNTFIQWLPENANQSTSDDQASVSKTSPTLFEYDVFKINWEKVATLREIDLMIKSDTRFKRANKTFATTAIRRGLTIKVSSVINENLAVKAQLILDELVRSTQLNSKLLPWARSLIKDGELYLNPIISLDERKITSIKNLPALTMQRNEDITGRFPDLNDAFRQIDPVSRQVLISFPLYSVNHIRHDHEPGQLYGNSQYLSCRSSWKKLIMMEEDLVVRRRTRSVPRRLHNVGTTDKPGDYKGVTEYKTYNKLDSVKGNSIVTDYYGNGLTSITDLNGDAHLDHIKDVEYHLENMMIGTGVPLHLLGFGKNVNRDIVEDQKKQFEEDVQEVRDLIEYGDESAFSGLRPIFEMALELQGIDPLLVSINLMWAESDTDDVDKKVDRIIKMRSAQPDPLVSRRFGLEYLGRDIGLENDEAIDNEESRLDDEVEEERAAQEVSAAAINPVKGKTSPEGPKTLEDAANKRIEFPLHSKKAAKLEKHIANETRRFFKKVLRTLKANGLEAKIEKVIKLRSSHDSTHVHVISDDILPLMSQDAECECSSCLTDAKKVQLSDLVEQNVIDELDNAWDEHADDLIKSLVISYTAVGTYAYSQVNAKSNGVTADFNNSPVKKNLEEAAGDRIKGIQETTKELVRKELAQAYEKSEPVSKWVERINKVMDIPEWRSEMIARTELSWSYNTANMSAYKESGITKVTYLAVLDNRTCPVCRGDNDVTFDIHSVPSLPRHPRCRCTTVAEF